MAVAMLSVWDIETCIVLSGSSLSFKNTAGAPFKSFCISIEVNGVQKFTGFQGAYKGKKAINIDELIYEPVQGDDMLAWLVW